MASTKLSADVSPKARNRVDFWQTRPVVVGAILAVGTVGIAVLLPHAWALDLYAALLALIGAVYIGMALEQGSQRQLVVQFVIALGFMGMGLLGLWFFPWLLVAGYFLHGVWDWLHHRGDLNLRLRGWYAPFCLVYDWLIAVAIGFFWTS